MGMRMRIAMGMGMPMLRRTMVPLAMVVCCLVFMNTIIAYG